MVVPIRVSADDGRMTGEVFFAEFQAKCLCLFHGQAVVGCIAWVKAYGLISSYMKAHKFSEAQVKGAESIESSVRLHKSNAKKMALNYYLLAYLISGDREFVLAGRHFDSIDALAEHMNTLLTSSFDKFDVFCKNIIGVDNSLDPQFEAWLIAQGKSNEIEQWKKTLL